MKLRRETGIILGVAAGALCFVGPFVHGYLTTDLPAVFVWLPVGMGLMFMWMTLYSMLPEREEIVSRDLEAGRAARRVVGTIQSIERHGSQETNNHRYMRLDLTIVAKLDGVPHKTTLRVKVEDALLTRFASGMPIHLLYDPADLSRVAIDRRASPLTVS